MSRARDCEVDASIRSARAARARPRGGVGNATPRRARAELSGGLWWAAPPAPGGPRAGVCTTTRSPTPGPPLPSGGRARCGDARQLQQRRYSCTRALAKDVVTHVRPAPPPPHKPSPLRCVICIYIYIQQSVMSYHNLIRYDAFYWYSRVLYSLVTQRI